MGRTGRQQGAGGRFGVVFAADGGHNGDPGDARFINGGGVHFADTADGDGGYGSGLKKPPQALQSHNGGRILFGARRKDGTDPDVIHRGRKARHIIGREARPFINDEARQFIIVGDRESHDGVGADDESAVYRRQIFLSDVHARRADRAGDVSAIVELLSKAIVEDAEYKPDPETSRLYEKIGAMRAKLIREDMREAFRNLVAIRSL